MKKMILIPALLAIALASFSQRVPTGVKTKEYYLTKGRHQKTAAWVMLGGGVALIGLGIALTKVEVVSGSDDTNTLSNVFAGIGVVSSLSSIPLFISAAKNKNRAAGVALNIQKIAGFTAGLNRTFFYQPAVALKVSL